MRPNILITGTPGTGKTTLSQTLSVREKHFYSERDEEFDTFVFDEESEDRLLDEMEPIMSQGGVIVDFHSSSLFPERWFQLVVVLLSDNTILYDRGYSSRKIEENVECEIMQVVAEEAQESYPSDVVVTLRNDTLEDMEDNLSMIKTWVAQFESNHPTPP